MNKEENQDRNRHFEKYSSVGRNIAYYRKQKNLSQEELACLVGISRQHMDAIEATNVNRKMSMDLFFDIADALDVKPEQLLNIKL